MGRWSRYTDSDTDLLPDGMRRIGYDASTASYTFRDRDGRLWTSAPGTRFGELKLITKAPSTHKKTGSHSSTATSTTDDELCDSPTEMKSPKKLHSAKRHEQPAPAYEKGRRFTDFGQLDEVTSKEGGGLLDSVKRSLSVKRNLSVKKSRPTSLSGRRGTV